MNVVTLTWYHYHNNIRVANNISSKIYWLSQSIIDSNTCSKTVSFAMTGGAATVLVCSATTNAEKKHILKQNNFSTKNNNKNSFLTEFNSKSNSVTSGNSHKLSQQNL